MMTSIGCNIPDQCVSNYLDALVGKIYKILPMKEDNAEFLQSYIERKIREMLAFQKFISIIGEDPDFLCLLLILYSLADQGAGIESVKHDVFEAIRLCKALSRKYRCEEVLHDG